MAARNVFALCALLMFAFIACASAYPQASEAENYGIVEDIIEYIKEKLRASKECVEEASSVCAEQYPKNPLARAKCIIDYVLELKGSCQSIAPVV